MEVIYQPYLHMLWIIPGILLVAYLGSPRFRGTQGQTRVQQLLKASLEKSRYTILNDVTLPSGQGGTVNIDHIVCSRRGIFVIETLYRNGVITGAEVQEQWKQSRMGVISRFDNPLQQNWLKISALRKLLDLPESRFITIVVFAGNSRFSKEVPRGVVMADQLIPRIRRETRQVFSPEEGNGILNSIESARLQPRLRLYLDPLRLLRGILAVMLLAGIYHVYEDEIHGAFESVKAMAKATPASLREAAHDFRTDTEKWEDSLVCVYSVDTGRCLCLEPEGNKVEIENTRCKALAERESLPPKKQDQ
jgi:hypothetical protein